jgi:RNA polymerase sigma factor (sigma-70 family)
MANRSLNGVLKQICKLAAVPSAHELADHELLHRFLAEKDEGAFTVLVQRHGAMVLGVCRRKLKDAHDAEDACQAAFLVLAQKAASIRKATSLPSWLHGVAARVAGKLERERCRRCKREKKSQPRTTADPAAEASWREVQVILDEELRRLPERLRGPLILCYLQGQTRDEAARTLGVSVASLHGRLERGRAALCKQLTRRGLTLSAALTGAALGEGISRAALSPTVVLSTARAALLLARARAVDHGLVSTKVLSLAQEVTKNMLLTKLKLGISALLCAGLLAAALGGWLASVGAGQEAQAPPPAGSPQPAADKVPQAPATAAQPTLRRPGDARPAQDARLSGRVLDLEDKPVAGAKVYLLKWSPPDRTPPKVWAETDKDGRFSFTAPPSEGVLFVTATGYGPGWVMDPRSLGGPSAIQDKQMVRLARDDVPVSGRVIDLQGQPVAGATVRVHALQASLDGSLDKWLAAVKARRQGEFLPEQQYLSLYNVDGLAYFFPAVTTDKEGRFQLRGVGRERVVAFTVEEPTIETQVIHVLTRPGVGAGDVRVARSFIQSATGVKELLDIYYPPTFTHTAVPCRVVTGTVRDKATGKPISGAVVRDNQPVGRSGRYHRTTTDKKGCFRLTGLPLGPAGGAIPSFLVAFPPDGEPYLALIKEVRTDKETKEATLDFDLPRGVWLEGQVKDKATGRGVPAYVDYYVFADAKPEELRYGLAGQGGPYYRNPSQHGTNAEGKFRILAAPDRGLLGARAIGEHEGRYRTGAGADQIDEGTRGPDGRIVFGRTIPPVGVPADAFDTVVEIKPEKGATTVRCDVELDPGRTLTVKVRGPDGKPLDGLRVLGQLARDNGPRRGADLLPAEFPVYGLDGKGRTLMVEQPGKNLAARCEIKGDERGPVVIDLQPAATVVGRLVDDDGRPLARRDIFVTEVTPPLTAPSPFPAVYRQHSLHVRTDATGKFRIDGLIPGLSYRGAVPSLGPYVRGVFGDLSLKSGETKDLGDVRVKAGDSQ